MNVCGRADEYVEGLLSPSEEEAFLTHLPGCARCQQDLEEDTQLRGAEERLRSARQPRVIPLRPRRWVSVAAISVAAAAAVLLMYVASRPDTEQPLLALAETRKLEGRLTYPAADRYRPPRQANRGENAPKPGQPHPKPGGRPQGSDVTPPEQIAELLRRGDLQGVASAYLLAEDYHHAAEYLEQLPSSPDVDSDRALLKLSKGQVESALVLLDEMLRQVPDHPQALWNRGLVLRELGLPLAAAESFTRVASKDPAWRDEALKRATVLREENAERRSAWWAAKKAGDAMVDGGPPLPIETVRRFPGMTRVFFQQALRLAPSPERVTELEPLAQELDRAHGGAELQAALERARAWNFELRRPLLKDYLDFVRHRSKLDEAGWRRWLEQARKAGADDLILGAIVHTRRTDKYLDELRRTAKADGTPWIDLYARTEEAKALILTGDSARGGQLLEDLLPQCERMRVPYRCMQVDIELMKLHLSAHRLQPAQVHAKAALKRARDENEWGTVSWLEGQLGEVERLRSRFAQARAYYEEAILEGSQEHCETTRDTRLNLAALYVTERRPEEAKREAAAAPACSSPLSLAGLTVHLDLHRMGQPVLSEEALRAEIASLRQRPGVSKGARLYADWAEARLIIDRDSSRGEELLRNVIRDAAGLPGDVTAAKVRSYAYTMLLVDAAKRGAFDRMAPLLTEEQGETAPPGPCTVAVARDDLRLAVAVRGASGALAGNYEEHSTAGAGTSPLTPRFLELLAECPAIRVLAQPPLTGTPRLLPPELAWSYDVAPGTRVPDASGNSRRVIVAGAKTPPELKLAPLSDWEIPAGAVRGGEATPRRVLLELTDATEIQFHVHALFDTSLSDAPVLALSPDGEGKWALTSEDIRATPLRRNPLVLLADCHAGELASRVHEAWGLPTAFLGAGASAVVASPADVPDLEAVRFFDAVLGRLRAGESPVSAVAAERRAWLKADPNSWVAEVLVFE
jgi:tetratricopeptide (TPR) repeat protein